LALPRFHKIVVGNAITAKKPARTKPATGTARIHIDMQLTPSEALQEVAEC